MEVEEITREPSLPPQLLRTVIQRGKEFEMLEEGEASAETKRLRNDLATMISCIEVSFGNPSIVSLEDHNLFNPLLIAEHDESVRSVSAATRGDGPGAGGEQESADIDE